VHYAQDSSWFILIHERSKVFKNIYTNCRETSVRESECPGNVRYPMDGMVMHLFTEVAINFFYVCVFISVEKSSLINFSRGCQTSPDR